MANSLLDQLQKSGLVDPKKAKQVAKEKRKQNKTQQKNGRPTVDENSHTLATARAEKIARDRQLNQLRNEKAERKALAAQIKQLIDMNAIDAAGDQTFNFTDGKYVKRIYVDKMQVNRLSRGVFAIVKQGDKYVIVPSGVAERIAERDPQRLIFKAEKDQDLAEDDPYAEYKIPDDLDW